jgi:hypothetical protein
MSEDIDVRIKQYEGWSLNNTQHAINLWGDNEHGVIHLVSNKEINVIEKLGIMEIVKYQFNYFKGYDIEAVVHETKYYKDKDFIYGYYDNNGTKTYNVSDYWSEYYNFKLEDAKIIITIKYHITKRYKQSKWWRLINKRKCVIYNELNME